MDTYKFNPLCPCKRCTGKGLGWIMHMTPAQSRRRIRRLEKERNDALAGEGLLPYEEM